MAPPRVREGASTAMPLGRLAPFYVFALACYCVSPFLGLDSRDVDIRIAEVWPPGGVGFVLLTVIWFSDAGSSAPPSG